MIPSLVETIYDTYAYLNCNGAVFINAAPPILLKN